MRIDKKEILTSVFVSALVLSNILSAKLVSIGWFVVPGGILCYAITYLMTDVIGELYGKDQARKTVIYGLVCQVICFGLMAITQLLPSKDMEVANAYLKLFRFNMWFTVAGLVAYILAQFIDVKLFHGIRQKFTTKGKNCKWVWNNTATILSQAVDTIVYITIAFGLGMQFFWVADGWRILLQMYASQYIVKVVLAIADTPFFYMLTKRRGG